jgi:cytoskeletal protein CcmA (bactofilin family)
MADVTVIGRGTHIRGRVSGAVDLEIQGHIDGEIAVDGDVTVDASGLVGASVSGKRLVVRGAVKGDLTGDDAVVLEQGARVVGDVRAPRVAIAPGALVKGYVQTGDASAPKPRAASAARPAARPAAAPAPRAVPKAAPSRPQTNHAARTTPVALSGAAPAKQGPPPPVVPALKKGAKGAMKKKQA